MRDFNISDIGIKFKTIVASSETVFWVGYLHLKSLLDGSCESKLENEKSKIFKRFACINSRGLTGFWPESQ